MEIQVPEPKDSAVVNYGFVLINFGSAFLKGKKKGRGIWPWIGNLI